MGVGVESTTHHFTLEKCESEQLAEGDHAIRAEAGEDLQDDCTDICGEGPTQIADINVRKSLRLDEAALAS